MTNVQLGYGHSDTVGVPFDFYAGASVVTGTTFAMQTNQLVLNPTGTLAAATVTLPLNPPDGCVAEISSTQILTSLTVNANTGDLIVSGVLGTVTGMTPVATVGAGSATNTVKYKYSLNGGITGGLNPRTWVRVQ
jgi:hypothetical protein